MADVRKLWPDVLDFVKRRRRFTWMMLSQNAQVSDVRDGVLTLAMRNAGARENFARGGNEEILKDALAEVLRVSLGIQTIIDGDPPPPGNARTAPAAPPAAPEAQPPAPPAAQAPTSGVRNEPSAAALARDQIRPTRARTVQEAQPEEDPDYDPYDDMIDSGDELPAHELLTKHLGAELIAEDDDNGA